MFSGKPNVYWEEKDNKEPWRAAGIVRIYSNKKVKMIKGKSVVMHPVLSVLLSFSAAFRQSFIHNGHINVGFIPVAYKEDYTRVQEITSQSALGTQLSTEHLNW